MLKEINNLGAFFEDCYKEWSVREYSRKAGISPPTSSKMLKSFVKEGLLKSREERGFLLFRVNKDSKIMKDFSIIYWEKELSELFDYLEKELSPLSIVLFGSLSKLEVTKTSDIDIAIFTKLKKDLDLNKLKKKFNREIQLFIFESFEKVNKQLKPAILNGQVIRGYLS